MRSPINQGMAMRSEVLLYHDLRDAPVRSPRTRPKIDAGHGTSEEIRGETTAQTNSKRGADAPEQRNENVGARVITLVATYTIDRISMGDGGFDEEPGGPAFYIGQALDRLGHPYCVVTGERAVTEVIMGSAGEEYIIPTIRPIPLPNRLPGAATILSPIMREIDPSSIPPTEGFLVADLQGFVRTPMVASSTGTRGADLTDLLSRATLIKASRQELGCLSQESLHVLAQTIYLETLGSKGVLVHLPGDTHFVSVNEIPLRNTIGAGDTLLAATVVGLIRGDPVLRAVEEAARFTEDWLRERLEVEVGLG